MSIQITIIGLGQVGSSIGLALAEQKSIKRVGHDKNFEAGRTAQKIGAVDEAKINLPASARDAQIVLLCLPLNEIRETLEIIASDLQEGAVIMDTAPAKATVAAWIKELLPQGRYYVGLAPAAGAGYLHGIDFGVESAKADLFKDGLFLVNAPYGTPGEVVKLATDLVGLLGAQAMISDEIEADGLLAYTHLLPQLLSAALIDMTVNQPGWQEARKVAARPYASVTAGLAYHDDVASLGQAALGNRENITRVLDTYIQSLIELRDMISENDVETVDEFLNQAFKARVRWIDERAKADWSANQVEQADIPSFGERFNQMFFGKFMDRMKNRK